MFGTELNNERNIRTSSGKDDDAAPTCMALKGASLEYPLRPSPTIK